MRQYAFEIISVFKCRPESARKQNARIDMPHLSPIGVVAERRRHRRFQFGEDAGCQCVGVHIQHGNRCRCRQRFRQVFFKRVMNRIDTTRPEAFVDKVPFHVFLNFVNKCLEVRFLARLRQHRQADRAGAEGKCCCACAEDGGRRAAGQRHVADAGKACDEITDIPQYFWVRHQHSPSLAIEIRGKSAFSIEPVWLSPPLN